MASTVQKTPGVTPGKLAKAVANSGKGLTGNRTTVTANTTALLNSQPVAIDGAGSVLSDFYRNGWYEKGDNGKGSKRIYPAKTLSPLEDKVASIRVYKTKTETTDPKTDKKTTRGGDLIPAYTKFMLESSQEAHQERHQIIETFGDFYVFFFGEAPPMYNFSGHLINAKNVNWVAEWQYYYENFLRGTKCADSNARIILTYGNIQIEGFILNFSTQHNAITEHGVPIQFTVVQTRRSSINMPDDFSQQEGVSDAEDTRKLLATIAGKEGAGTSAKDTSKAFNKAKEAVSGEPASTMDATGYTEPLPGEPVQTLP